MDLVSRGRDLLAEGLGPAPQRCGEYVEEHELWVPGLGFVGAPAGRWRLRTHGSAAHGPKGDLFSRIAPALPPGLAWRIAEGAAAAGAVDELGWERRRRRSLSAPSQKRALRHLRVPSGEASF